jgi:anthraniloyl-CoA monooxygenase
MEPRPVALLGDAVHTAHFSVGSGTKMAMEDAIALARALAAHPSSLEMALTAYEAAAQPQVRKIQDSARPSLAWWEHFGTYHDAFEPWQFAYHFLTRSMTDARLARRAPDFIGVSHRAWEGTHGAEPLRSPFSSGDWSANGRVVTITAGSGGIPVSAAGQQMPLADSRPYGTWKALPLAESRQDGPWGALIQAPDGEDGLPEAGVRLTELAAAGPVLAAIYGGTPLTRTLLSEHARLQLDLPTLVIDPGFSRDEAVTSVLSGRADLVGVPAATASDWERK